MLKSLSVFLVLFLSIVRAEPRVEQIKWLHQLVKQEYTAASLLWSVVAIETDLLENIRLFGNTGNFDGVHPTIHPKGSEIAAKDSPQDWFSAFLQFFFPSSGLVGLIPSTVTSDYTRKMKIEAIGRLVQALVKFPGDFKEIKAAHAKVKSAVTTRESADEKYQPRGLEKAIAAMGDIDEERLLAGAIMQALNPPEFNSIYKKQVQGRGLKKVAAANSPLGKALVWDVLGVEVQQVATDTDKSGEVKLYGRNKTKDRKVIAYVTAKAFMETQQANGIYPPHLVELTLGALAWKKAESKADLLPYFKAMSDLLIPGVQFGKKGKFSIKTADSSGTGQVITKEQWLSAEYTKSEYKEIKKLVLEDKNKAEAASRILADPEFSAFLGSGYNLYDAKFPPARTYGSVKHPSLKNKNPSTLPDCGSTSLRSFFEMVLFNHKTRRFEVKLLQDIAKELKLEEEILFTGADESIEGALGEFESVSEEMSRYKASQEMQRLERLQQIMAAWNPLKRLIWFFRNHPKPTKAQSASNDWILITSSYPKVKYRKGATDDDLVCEIDAGITNMLKVIANLIPDKELGKILDQAEDNSKAQHKANADALSRLCELVSSNDKNIEWLGIGGSKNLYSNTGITLKFEINDKPAFTWDFLSGHFDVKPIVDEIGHWQLQLRDNLAAEYNKSIKSYLFNHYVGNKKIKPVIEKYSDMFWYLIYGSTGDELGRKNAITRLLEVKQPALQEKYYRLAWHWMNKFPIEDARIRKFIADRLLMVSTWVDALPADDALKIQRDKYLAELKNVELKTFVEEGFVNLLLWQAKLLGVTITEELVEENMWLHKASGAYNPEMLDYFLSLGVDINSRDIYGDTAFHTAAQKGVLEMLIELLDRGGDINAVNTDGYGPIIFAISGGQETVAIELLRLGARANYKEGEENPLASAALHSSQNLVRELIKAGADFNKENNRARLPLDLTVGFSNVGAARELIISGADVNAESSEGVSALDRTILIKRASVEIIIELLAGGAYFDEEMINVAIKKAEGEKAELWKVLRNFVFPNKAKNAETAMGYLDLLQKFAKEGKVPPRILAYWNNQTLSGRQFGLSDIGLSDTSLDKAELESILRSIVISAQSREYQEEDRWLAWTMYKNDYDQLDSEQQEQIKNVYTLIRYAQMRLAKMSRADIYAALKVDDKAYNDLELEGYPNITEILDNIIDSMDN